MITKIYNYTHKSFNNYTGPEDDFRKKNIIFGYNGSGKSSLVKGLENQFLSMPSYNKDNYRIYSSDFINKSLLLDPKNRRHIRGVKVVFGEKNVAVEEEIKKLEATIIKQTDIDKIMNESIKMDGEIKAEISKIFSAKKGTLSIKGKSTSLPVDDIIKAYKDDYINALKVEPDPKNIEKSIGDDTVEKRIATLELLDEVPEIPLKQIDFEKISFLQDQSYDDVLIPNSTIVKWLVEGLDIHESKERCEFCESPIEYKKIKDRIDTYTKNIKYASETFFKDTYVFMITKITSIKIVLLKRESFRKQIGQFEDLFIELDRSVNEIEEYIDKIKSNSENIIGLRKIDITEFKSTCIRLSDNIVKINNFRKSAIDTERVKLDKLGVLVKAAVSMAISKSTIINANLEKISTNQKTIKLYTETNKDNFQRIKVLKDSKVVTADFKNLVNQIMKDINISIELEIDGNDYFLKSTLLEKPELTIDDISEGEKNLLSLVFFYYEMFEDEKQSVLKTDIRLIVLDDPISSMDDSNRFYVLELVRNIVQLEVDQVFVLSHVWDDYCQLIFKRESDPQYASYEIRKTSESFIYKNNSKGNPYKFMFKQLYELSLKSSLSTDCDYYHTPNTIRKVFEEFLFFKTNKTMLAQNSNKAEIESLFSIESNTEKRKLATLLSVSNVLSHTNTKTNEDILIAAKYLMSFIEHHDKIHYHAMIQ
jgi:hypothetical protein